MQSGSSLRVHRRSLYLNGANWTIFTPRPNEAVRLATGVTDETVSLYANAQSLEFLGQCLWAMAYQRHERTVFLFDRPVMIPNPTTGDLSRPVVVANTALGPVPAAMLDGLRPQLPLEGPTDGTIKLRTAGLDRALADPAGFATREAAEEDAIAWTPSDWDQWVKREAGLVTVHAPAPVLRAYARATAEFGSFSWESLDGTGFTAPETVTLRFDAGIVGRADALRDRRLSRFPGRGLVDLVAAEREELWSEVASDAARSTGGMR
ncbi:MAG: hypothetical protein JJE46_05215 [Acidimicrobiia bacterium]|nr:hypothetical protein [Acidimicrobiia bacterium]